jgi:hypothetical protein
MPKGASPLVVVAAVLTACAGPALRPTLKPAAAHPDALLILPGVGYGRDDGEAFRAIAASAGSRGLDVYVPHYVTRGGLDESRAKLRAYIAAMRLDRYERLHVFAFIAGAWVFNPLADGGGLTNLRTVVYDRSPFQERAPSIAVEALRIPAWLRFGTTIFDLARTPYPPLTVRDVRVALLVETVPTTFIKHHDRELRARGPVTFDCDALGQPYDACAHVALNHDDIYARFGDVWPDVRRFIDTGRLQP